MRRAPDGWPTWQRPAPYGIAEAIGAAGTVVAPLLAGFSVTLIVLILGVIASDKGANATSLTSHGAVTVPPATILHPDLALVLLIAAAGALLAAVQCAFWARQYQATPSEIEQWWGALDDLEDVYIRSNWEQARKEQLGYTKLQLLWIQRFRVAYHAGILLILSALTIVLIPGGEIGVERWCAIAAGILATTAEATWIAATALAARGTKPKRSLLIIARRLALAIIPPLRLELPGDLIEGDVSPDGPVASGGSPVAPLERAVPDDSPE
jgi:hypothetical protein